MGSRREQIAAAELARQTQQFQLLARESQNEARRLASAIDTLNSDRDRLYTRVTVLEQGLDSVTGSIAKQGAAPAPAQSASAPTEAPVVAQNPPPAAAPTVSPAKTVSAATVAPAEKPPAAAPAPEPAPATVASVPAPVVTTAPPLMPSKSIMAPPDPAAAKLIETGLPPKPFTAAPIPDVVASAPPAEDADADASDAVLPKVQQTEFAIDVGGASSISGLRALWRGLVRADPSLASLRPLIAVREIRGGYGTQLRLVAGPLKDAAAAAKICAALSENKRACETTEFDGQRLVMKGDEVPPVKPASRKRGGSKHVVVDEPKKPESLASATSSKLSAMFSRR